MVSDKATWLEITARTGYIAKGIVYFTIGLLAFQTAIGMGGETSGAQEILKQFIYQPFGYILLTLCTLGLIAHAVWRIIQGISDPEDRGDDKSTLLFRSIDFIIGLMYLSLSYAAYQILTGSGSSSSDQSTEIWISKILTLPGGKWIVLFIAAVTLIIGLYQFYSVYTADFDYSFDKNRMDDKEKKGLRQLGRIGIGAWGVVYCMLAFLFYESAMNYNADQAGGLGDALKALADQPYGVWVLGITSGGLIIYGVYLFVLSYYHQIYD